MSKSFLHFPYLKSTRMKTQSICSLVLQNFLVLRKLFVLPNFNVDRSLIESRTHVVFLCTILFAARLTSSQAQNTWIQKADFGGTARTYAVGFSIGSKGYIGTGLDLNYNYKKDFWEYDASTNAWTQKADFGGTARFAAVGFSIGDKGYIGTGVDLNYQSKKDFWEYDPSINAWTQKANFGGAARRSAVGFSLANKGYIGTGYVASGYPNDFWEYDPSTNGWTQKANFAGAARANATGFAIGNKGYIGTGNNTPTSEDFWEYDPAINTWTQKADFAGYGRSQATGFSIGSKGYIGAGYRLGVSGLIYFKDFWEYNPGTNAWTQQADFGGNARENATGFSIDDKGYLGMGYSTDGSYNQNIYFYNDFWEYTPQECTAPDELFITDLTATTVKLNWNAAQGVAGYKVRYKIAGTSGWMNVQSIDKNKIINGLVSNTKYVWQVKSICSVLPIISSGWSPKQTFTTGSLRIGDELSQQILLLIYPNPAEDLAIIQFTLTQSSHVNVKVYDVNGKEITTLINDEMQQGDHLLQLKTDHFAKGVYVVKMISDFGIEKQKLIVQ